MSTNKNPFPFYTLDGDIWTNFKPLWHKNNRNCIGTCCYEHKLYPGLHWFQHKLESSIASSIGIEAVEVRNVSDNSIVADTTINTTLMQDESANKYLLISLDIDSSLIGSQYYMSIETENVKYYSEIFCVANQTNDKIGLIWTGNNRVGNMVYSKSFKHQINLDARIVHAEPQLEQQVVENGYGEETPTLQKLTQAFTFSCIVPNFIAEALSALPLHKQFNVFNYYNGEPFINEFDSEITAFNVSVSPEDNGCNSFVQVTYTKEIVIETGCDDSVYEVTDIVAIYKNNQPDEFDFSAASFNVTPNPISSVEPQEGPVHLAVASNQLRTEYSSVIRFQSNQQHPTAFKKITFQFKQVFVHDYNILFQIINTDTSENESYVLNGNAFGLDINSTDYQAVTLPINESGVSSFDRFLIIIIDQGIEQPVTHTSFYIDNIVIEDI